MPRKTHFKNGKRGTRNKSRRVKSKTMNRSRSMNRSRTLYKSKSKTRRYRGGCENDSCSLSGSSLSNSQLWTSKGGSDTISKDIYDHRTDKIFYSSSK
jgi:hypothetical protein